jgi:hypothetical protein
MKKYSILFFLTVAIIIQSCGQDQPAKVDKLTPEELKAKYDFKPVAVTEIPEALKQQLYIPFLDNGHYYLTDYDGNRITSKQWDEIILGQYNFYWARNKDTYWLYTFPENLVVDYGFKFTLPQVRELLYFVKVEKETRDSFFYYVSIDNTQIEMVSSENGNSSSEIEDVAYREVNKPIKHYFSVENPRKKSVRSTGKSPVFYEKADNKYALIDSSGNRLTEPVFTHTPMIYERIQWVVVRQGNKYGVLDFNNNWIFPLEARKISKTYVIGRHGYTFELREKGYSCKFNEKLELLLEKPFVFIKKSDFEWEKVPEDIRPPLEKVKRPLVYQEYYVMSANGYGHVFTAEGKYISSHKGKYDENVSLNGLPKLRKYQNEFTPIGKFTEAGIDYYVRLSDGFEYREP